MSAAKLAVSIPAELFEQLESARKKRGLTRSAVLQLGLRAWLGAQRERRRVQEYVAGYEATPETDEDVREARAMVRAIATRRRSR